MRKLCKVKSVDIVTAMVEYDDNGNYIEHTNCEVLDTIDFEILEVLEVLEDE